MAFSLIKYITRIRLSRCLLLMFVVLISTPLIIYQFLNHADKASSSGLEIDGSDPAVARRNLQLLDFDKLSGSELKKRLDDLLRIKHSVLTELRYIEQDRAEKLKKKSSLDELIEKLRKDADKEQSDLERLRVSINQAQLVAKELRERNNPEVLPPLKIISDINNNYKAINEPKMSCTIGTCFDISRCPLSSGFPVFFYESSYAKWLLDGNGFGHLTDDPETACVFVAAFNFSDQSQPNQTLSYWKGDGRNHILIDADIQEKQLGIEKAFVNNLPNFNFGRALIASFRRLDAKKTPLTLSFRRRFDITLPPVYSRLPGPELWVELNPILPIRRRLLLFYEGTLPNEKEWLRFRSNFPDINGDRTDDKIHINFDCSIVGVNLCSDAIQHKELLREATFTLVPVGQTPDFPDITGKITESLKEGSVPLLVCASDCDDAIDALPFSEVVDYRKVVVVMSLARITEMHFLIRSIPDTDLFYMRRQGRLIWQNYLGSTHTILSSMIGLLRQRIGLPAAPMLDKTSTSIFNDTYRPLLMDHLISDTETSESLGPIESPSPSLSFRRNFSASITNGYDIWNTHFYSANMAPFTPWEPILPTEAKFLGSSAGFRPIGSGEGGSGFEFSQAIGGNIPHEQFTVVMLTYMRELVLVDSLARLNALPYLNKVVVVWNAPDPPSEDLRWPEIGVPIIVVRTDHNSLNNRFLPYDVIETEAVLSVDDDAHLRHDEIIFGFRVWRENRDRLVGFPGRYHAWDMEHKSWNYNSNYSCELSMVLTGAAFYHKFYSYAYFDIMPKAIRDKVDELTNCEDLAMNFLISHMTRKPPVKVTSRWTFRCQGCPVSLSEDDSHFQERHQCINYFVKVYGYNPLLYTQYRVDSVLFKTRIPQDKQKCFKYI